MESFDLVVIGAGFNGLCGAKTYLEYNPNSKILIVDAESTIGGVWAKHRLYKSLKTNNLFGNYEFSDFPMDGEAFGVKDGQHIPGTVVHGYLEAYANHFGLTERMKLRSKVLSAEHQEDRSSWILTIDTDSGGMEAEASSNTSIIITRRLVVATGFTSQAFLPAFKGQELFNVPLFHCRNLLQHQPDLLESETEKKVVVYGGTKSAWDAAYACAISGVPVTMVIRESGHGPCWMSEPYGTPIKMYIERLIMTRFITYFSPCIWATSSLVRSFLYRSWIGRKFVNLFWFALAHDMNTNNKYDQHPETKKLKPWTSPFWIGSGLSILNYETNFFDLVKSGKIKIQIADIISLSSRKVHLSNDTVLDTDALICATGWKATPPISFLPDGIQGKLGLPWSADPLDESLLRQAEEEILTKVPALRDQPVMNRNLKPISDDAEACTPHPLRLVRFIAPPRLTDRSIVFLGTTLSTETTMIAQAQSLWATAYFADKLNMRSTAIPAPELHRPDSVDWEIALHSEFGRFRYPGGLGKRNPDFIFDALPYVDLLLGDLGLNPYRKGGFFADHFTPYKLSDYKGLVEEWKANTKKPETSK
ncbi:hypothetical protein FQN57_005717 [Myotisia sp. PD_48]|nr:hypothetical protein FQN57_005717 [Myotisia sp. PD_48]